MLKEKSQVIEQVLLDFPICEYTFGKVEQIPFSDKVWFICETDCERYGHSWACPPYCGDLKEKIQYCKKYSQFLIFSTVTEVKNRWDQEECLKVKTVHEKITREIREQLQEQIKDFYILSTGCTACEKCACPEEPCRHPESRLSSMESHGIVILQLVNEMGLTYAFDNDSVVYFSMILF
ncbi:MAG: DUF2284 domain-containing protein [Lachnospiraceae bacterium]|nr:DUF2284 domain-containing protein [Lachnospiraceae bacterium]